MIRVLCPTRGRSQRQLDQVLDSFFLTSTISTTRLQFVTEDDQRSNFTPQFIESYVLFVPQTGCMSGALNAAVSKYMFNDDKHGITGFIGDDHRFRTIGWDSRIRDALENGGIAWAFDGVHGAELPTQWFVSNDIINKLGWLALPRCKHFYLDNAWVDLAEATNTMHYLPDVLIEHLHFSYGKSEIDDTYRHSMNVGAADGARYWEWRNSGLFSHDVMAVQEAMKERNENTD